MDLFQLKQTKCYGNIPIHNVPMSYHRLVKSVVTHILSVMMVQLVNSLTMRAKSDGKF